MYIIKNMNALKSILIVIFIAGILSQFNSDPFNPGQPRAHAPGQHNPNAGTPGQHNPNGSGGTNHVFLVKTDLTKEQVEALLKKAEVEAQIEPQEQEEPVEQTEAEAVEPEQIEPEEPEPIEEPVPKKSKGAHNTGAKKAEGTKHATHGQTANVEFAANQETTTAADKQKAKEDKIQAKADRAAKKQAAKEAQMQGKNAKAEQKKVDQAAKQKQKADKAAMKQQNAEIKKQQKEQKVLDKQNHKLSQKLEPQEISELSQTENIIPEEITVVTEVEEGITELRGGKGGNQGGKGNKGSVEQGATQGKGKNQRKRIRQHNPSETQPEAPMENEAQPAPTNLLKMTEPKKEVSVSSFVALFMILFTFVALILLATQYDSVKRHFKLDIKNEGLTDYLLVDEKHGEKNSDYPNIRDF